MFIKISLNRDTSWSFAQQVQFITNFSSPKKMDLRFQNVSNSQSKFDYKSSDRFVQDMPPKAPGGSGTSKLEIEGVPPIAVENLLEYCYKDRYRFSLLLIVP